MTLLLTLALFLQDDLSAKAKEFLAAVNEIRAGMRTFESLRRDLTALRDEYATAGEDRKKVVEKEFNEKSERFSETRAALQEKIPVTQKEIEASIAAAPKDLGLLDARSLLFEILGEHEKALPDLEKLLAARPGHLPYLVRRAGIERHFNLYDEARKRLAEVLKKEPGLVDALAEDGLCAFALNEFAACVERLEAVSKQKDKLSPQHAAEVDVMLPAARERVKFWEEEQKLRAAEAKADTLPRVKIVTSAGEIEIELFEDSAPVTVANFIALAEAKFFDDTRFHRVIPNFMVQCGDPNSRDADPNNDGQGGPGYSFEDELPEGRYRRHFRGSLSMANSGPDTNGSQFFITHLPTPWLDGKHVVFGRVIKGLDVVGRIKGGDAFKSVAVIRKRNHPYGAPKKK